ncbi:MAG: hypothetical protein ACKVZ6_06140, partial [Kineosporiaceae bacterium]
VLGLVEDRSPVDVLREASPRAAATATARQLVTCGLGGAYHAETHRLPARVVLPAPASRMATPDQPVAFDLEARWPSRE